MRQTSQLLLIAMNNLNNAIGPTTQPLKNISKSHPHLSNGGWGCFKTCTMKTTDTKSQSTQKRRERVKSEILNLLKVQPLTGRELNALITGDVSYAISQLRKDKSITSINRTKWAVTKKA